VVSFVFTVRIATAFAEYFLKFFARFWVGFGPVIVAAVVSRYCTSLFCLLDGWCLYRRSRPERLRTAQFAPDALCFVGSIGHGTKWPDIRSVSSFHHTVLR